MEDTFTIAQCAKHADITKQAVYLAIKKNKLKASKKDGVWMITKTDYEVYQKTKRSRDGLQYQGEKVYSEDFLSVHNVIRLFSNVLGCEYPKQRLYYLMRKGELNSYKKGWAWVIARQEALDLLEQEKESSNKKQHRENLSETELTVQECANLGRITKHSIYLAIKKKKLQAHKRDDIWIIHKSDYELYQRAKRSRADLEYQGEKVYSENILSVNTVLELLSENLGYEYPKQRLYYLMRKGHLKSSKRGWAWVVTREDALALLEEEKRVPALEPELCEV